MEARAQRIAAQVVVGACGPAFASEAHATAGIALDRTTCAGKQNREGREVIGLAAELAVGCLKANVLATPGADFFVEKAKARVIAFALGERSIDANVDEAAT
ncbi:MAG: hypothetical protein IPK60_21965 [Sandaracinaceae bacterium]|nr:hypothetical protein [Sandaracinaceae bacterium]